MGFENGVGLVVYLAALGHGTVALGQVEGVAVARCQGRMHAHARQQR
jgi:hypothetical protein